MGQQVAAERQRGRYGASRAKQVTPVFAGDIKTPPAIPSPSVRSSPSHKHPHARAVCSPRPPQAKMKSAALFSAAALVASVAGLTVNTPCVAPR